MILKCQRLIRPDVYLGLENFLSQNKIVIPEIKLKSCSMRLDMVEFYTESEVYDNFTDVQINGKMWTITLQFDQFDTIYTNFTTNMMARLDGPPASEEMGTEHDED